MRERIRARRLVGWGCRLRTTDYDSLMARTTLKRLMMVFLLIAAGCGTAEDPVLALKGRNVAADVRSGRDATTAAFEALEQGDTDGFLASMVRADSLRPGHPTLRFHLARALALAGRPEEALAELTALSAAGMRIRLDDPAFTDLDSDPRFEGLRAEQEVLAIPRVHSRQAWEGRDADLQPEGIAFMPDGWRFGSVHKARIVSGANRTWVRTDGYSAMGMEWDGEWLWSAQTMTAEGGAAASRIGRSRVVAYDTEGLERAIFSPQDSLEHWFGDLTIGSDGVVVVSDSRAPGLYRIVNGHMMPWLTGDPFVSPQGLAFLDGFLYVADYSVGLFRVDPKAGTIRWMETPTDAVLMGIDGLEAGGGFLWGIQNGTNPTRVVRIRVSGDRIRDVKAFDIGHPDHSDPTLGLVRNDTLFYVANSQWPLFGPEGGEGVRQPPIVLALPLDAE